MCILAFSITPFSTVFGDAADFDINAVSPNTPAVFYDSDPAQFDVEITSTVSDNKAYDIEYTISLKNYNYDCYKANVDYIKVKSFKRTGVVITSDKSLSDSIYFDLKDEKYGLYNLNVKIKNGSATVCEKDFPFAKSTVSENLNKTYGASLHLTRYADHDIVLNMMKNAGLGIARDDFNWDKYEKKAGEYKLDDKQVKTLKKAKEYGIDMLAILTGYNKLYSKNAEYSSLPDLSIYDESLGKTYADAYKAYAANFVKEPLVKDVVTMAELVNEPLGVISDSTTSEQQKEESYKVGQLYANTVKSGYQGVKENSDSIKVGAFSAFKLGYQAEYFIDGALSNMDKQYYDAFTIHDYKERGTDGDPEPGYSPMAQVNRWYPFLDGAVSTVKRFDDLMSGVTKGPKSQKTYSNFSNQERWYTERGFSTDDKPSGDNYSQNPYYDQALNLVRSKIVTDAYNGGNMKDKTWIYDFSDDNANGNSRESSFGIVESHLDENPYAPKPAYIAVANYNSLVADATKCEKVDDDDINEANGDYIYKYTCKNRTVYIPYHTKGDDPAEVLELAYDKIGDGSQVHIYDFWGNEIQESNIYKNGKYLLTKQPYYICVGEPVNRNVKHIKNVGDSTVEKIMVDGNISSGERGRRISIVVTKPGEELNEYSVLNSLYFNQADTDDNGYFKFEFGVPKQDSTYKAYVKSDDAESYISFDIASGRTKRISISLMKDIVKLKSDDIKQVDLSNLSALVEYSTADKEVPYKLYCALYKNNVLVNVVSLDGRMESLTDGNKIYPINFGGVGTSDTKNYDKVSLFMFDSDNTLTPLCSACTVEN